MPPSPSPSYGKTYQIGEPIFGADGATTFGDDSDCFATLKYNQISVEGAFIAPPWGSVNYLSVLDSVWFLDPIGCRYDKKTLGVLKVDYFDYYLGPDEGAYAAVGPHHHLYSNISEPKFFSKTDTKWYKYGGKQQAGHLVTPGDSANNWTVSHDDLPDDYIIGTMMSNITTIPVRDDEGKAKENWFYDNNGNPVDLATVSGTAVLQVAPMRMIYFKSDNPEITGYYAAMVP